MSELDQAISLQEIVGKSDASFFVMAKDISSGHSMGLNADKLTATASCIKLFILIELARQIDQGSRSAADTINVTETDRVGGSGVLKFMHHDTQMSIEDVAMFMMSLSDNTATNILIDLLGIENINNTALAIGCENTTLHNRVDFKAIGSDIRNLATSTAAEFAQALELIATDRLFSPAASRFVMNILSTQQHLDLLPRYLGYNQYAKDLNQDQDIEIANKTGFFPGFRGDVAIITVASRKIVIAAFAEGIPDKTFDVDHPESKIFGAIGRFVVNNIIKATD